jgi:hypothetical protein
MQAQSKNSSRLDSSSRLVPHQAVALRCRRQNDLSIQTTKTARRCINERFVAIVALLVDDLVVDTDEDGMKNLMMMVDREERGRERWRCIIVVSLLLLLLSPKDGCQEPPERAPSWREVDHGFVRALLTATVMVMTRTAPQTLARILKSLCGGSAGDIYIATCFRTYTDYTSHTCRIIISNSRLQLTLIQILRRNDTTKNKKNKAIAPKPKKCQMPLLVRITSEIRDKYLNGIFIICLVPSVYGCCRLGTYFYCLHECKSSIY